MSLLVVMAMVLYGAVGIFFGGRESRSQEVFYLISLILEFLLVVGSIVAIIISLAQDASSALLIGINLWLLGLYIDIFASIFFRKKVFGF